MDFFKEKLKRFHRLELVDMVLWKLALLVFGIFLTKVFPWLLRLDAGVLLIIFVIVVAKPVYKAWIEEPEEKKETKTTKKKKGKRNE
ncbi:MAG: hypothetical protein AABY11_00395 [archaeon]|mgnify:CR=1 FL=1